jgi:hypothetical protein
MRERTAERALLLDPTTNLRRNCACTLITEFHD